MYQKNIPHIVFLALLAFVAAMLMSSCVDESISADAGLKLDFSIDTLQFDTVFTTIGSSTSQIKVYNPNNKNVNISAIGLGMGASSPYRINVDGATNKNNQFTDIELRAGDSLFIFVEVTIDPLKTNAPVFVKDSIVFLTNSNHQDVKLLAYGQDMEILNNRIIHNDTTLTGEKPYLVYGDLVVDTAKTLTLAAGCRLYFHNQASMVVYGNLTANGTREQPVMLRGDRTDRIFTDIPYNYVSNQWGGVLLLSEQGKHKLNFVTMNSGYAGVYLANQNRNERPTLEITNCRIHNFLKYGLVVQNADVLVANTEISNTGAYSVYLNGGKHTFIHTTIANYFNSTNVRIQPSSRENYAALMIMELNRIIPMETIFENCIISGSTTDEMDIMTRFSDQYHGRFSNSYIRRAKPENENAIFNQISWYDKNKRDTVFVSTYLDSEKLIYYNFRPDSVSPARNIGSLEAAKKYPFDLSGNNRLEDNKPDAGAYEWQPWSRNK